MTYFKIRLTNTTITFSIVIKVPSISLASVTPHILIQFNDAPPLLYLHGVNIETTTQQIYEDMSEK